MARRPKSLLEKQAPPPGWLLRAIEVDAGKGVSNDILDYAFWRGRQHLPDDDIVAALDKADRGDPEPIAQILESDRALPPLARYYLDNLIARGNASKEKTLSMSKADRQNL